MDPRELAGREGGKGKSAELFGQAWPGGGPAGNTRWTVRGNAAAGALSANRDSTLLCVNGLSVGACLYRLFILVSPLFRSAARERPFFRHAAPGFLDINKLCLRNPGIA